MSSSICIGVFDGLHRGHAAILARAVERARQRDARCIVVSFDPHPDLVLSKSFVAPAPLSPLPEKRELLRQLGADAFELIPFTRELASLSPEDFVDRHLVEPFNPHALVVGENFALGRGRAGNVTRLRSLGRTRGFEVEAVPLLEMDGGLISSTRIREALGDGQVVAAARWLGRPYGLAGTVVQGDAIGRTLGVPTANIRLHDEKLVPGHGIYAVWARIEREGELRPAVMSIGVRPTFGGQVRTLEVHLLEWEGELVGRPLEVEFVDWLRPELKFDGREALIAAMRKDIEDARRRLAEAAASQG